MVGLAILGLGLTVLIKSTANSMFAAEDAHQMGIATDLARAKMDDIEERLLKEGFTDTDQSQLDYKPFEEEGWPQFSYAYKVEIVEFPNFDDLQKMAMGRAQQMAGSGSAGFGSGFGSNTFGSGSAGWGSDYGSGTVFGSAFGSGYGSGDNVFGSGDNPLGGFQNSALGGMLGMMGMMGGGNASGAIGAQGGALIQSQYTMFQQILKVTVRKVSLDVRWKVLGRDRSMRVVAFYTDPSAMDQVLNGLGAQDLGSGSGSGSGSAGSGSGSGSGTKLTPGGSGTH